MKAAINIILPELNIIQLDWGTNGSNDPFVIISQEQTEKCIDWKVLIDETLRTNEKEEWVEEF